MPVRKISVSLHPRTDEIRTPKPTGQKVTTCGVRNRNPRRPDDRTHEEQHLRESRREGVRRSSGEGRGKKRGCKRQGECCLIIGKTHSAPPTQHPRHREVPYAGETTRGNRLYCAEVGKKQECPPTEAQHNGNGTSEKV